MAFLKGWKRRAYSPHSCHNIQPDLSEHTKEILNDLLGMSAEELEELEKKKMI